LQEEGQEREEFRDVPIQEAFITHLAYGESFYWREAFVSLVFSQPLLAENTNKNGGEGEREAREPEDVHA
jgi:hypothetical protein